MLTAAVLLLVLLQEGAAAAVEPPFELQVNHAIASGAAWLRQQQQTDGSWNDREGLHAGGVSSLVMYTLRKSGVPPGDENFRKGMEFLVKRGNPTSTYGASVHLLWCASMGQSATWRERARGSLKVLVDGQREGVWGYPADPLDLSNTAFALLGLRAAGELGLEPPEATLAAVAEAIWRHQLSKPAGFRYRPEDEPTASINAAALGSLAILQDFADGGMRDVEKELRKHAKELAAAEAWMEEDFSLERNRRGALRWTTSWHYCHLWSVERWAGFTGRKEIAGHDWYREGAEWLIARQDPDGKWESLESTCFALLFLRRATMTQDPRAAELLAEWGERRRAEWKDLHPAAGVPYLRDWLLCGPWTARTGLELLQEPPFAPGKVKDAEAGKTGPDRKKWDRVRLNSEGWTDLDEASGRGADQSLWALATWIDNGAPEPVDALLWLAFEDGWSVWLDGAEVSRSLRIGTPILEDTILPVTLAPGRHLLLVLLEDAGGAAAFSARITDPEGLAQPQLRSASGVRD
jgi:hypothetical protein